MGTGRSAGTSRIGRLALASVVVAPLLAACGGGSGSSGTALKIWDYSAEQTDFHKKVTEEFHRQHPDITVQWQSISQDEYKRTLPLAFQSGQGPDIFYWSDNGPLAMSQLLDQKWIQPLDGGSALPASFTERWPAGSFVNGVNQLDGKTYGFPLSESTYWGPGYMFLNKKVFADAGLDTAAPPKTWSDLKTACARIKAETKAYCIAAPTKDVDFQRIFYALAAGEYTFNDWFFDYRKGTFSLAEPQAQKVFAFIQELKKDGYLAPGTNDKNFSRQQFASGQAGIMMDGTWLPSVLTSLGMKSDQYAVAPHPVPDDGSKGALWSQPDGNKYWVSAKSKQSKAAWTFLDWMTRPDGYFAKEYLKDGFGTLAFADNARYITDPAIRRITKIADEPGYRVKLPLPVAKCPDLVKSKAYVKAIGERPTWEYEAMSGALNSGTSLRPEAQRIVAARQKTLTDQLKQEAAQGLKVSLDCFTFPDWSYTSDYRPAK
ncbi:ABC transporter substrate-binding protein [Streptomyces echinatus]|uniref:ABC-type glycerol-3-phosphate transport system substrate-binding protein n=1 Tax=Streptomyces echinatus TaxID=67293 RepID=A0A7W9PPR5_9ACTN|nr:extracellular solute-binding protein [Streptomyces echinatus]MBB5925639.1 ABC-type glycerol-3-phosphate transport system substrate-binding protein [Streptomyces echinatus]